MDYGYANYFFMTFMFLFYSVIIIGVGYAFGYDNCRKDRNDETNTEVDRETLSRDTDDNDVSDNTNRMWICDFRYLEDLQERLNMMRGTLSYHEREMIDEVDDVFDFVIETFKEYEGITEEEEGN